MNVQSFSGMQLVSRWVAFTDVEAFLVRDFRAALWTLIRFLQIRRQP